MTPAKIDAVVCELNMANYGWQPIVDSTGSYAKRIFWAKEQTAYCLAGDEYDLYVRELSSRHDLEAEVVERLGRDIADKAANLFYDGENFDWPGYLELWREICRCHTLLCERGPSLIVGTDSEVEYGSLRVLYHDPAMRYALESASGIAACVAPWYVLGIHGSVKLPIAQDICASVAGEFGSIEWDKVGLFHDFRAHPEADYYIVLAKRYSRFISPMASSGFRVLGPELASLENLQGNEIAPGLPPPPKCWRHLMVRAAEQLMASMGIKYILFRPEESHMSRKDAGRNGVDLAAIMNGTARQMRYRKVKDSKGQNAYFKSLPDNDLPSYPFALPEHRKGDGWIAH